MHISPSLASAPLLQLERTLKELEAARADFLHFDIEDGSFVPVMTLGTKLISDLRPRTELPFDVHLMMVNPEWLISDLASIGVDRISVHYEACRYPRRVLHRISDLGIAAGLALNPATPLPDLAYLSPHLSFILILSSEPEVADSPFLPQTLDKVRYGKSALGGSRLEWVVDGGVRAENVAEVVRAGADTVVVGRGVFNDKSIAENMQALRAAAG
ncbi:MAG TPA: ribulose-phosphate 3-epimerase [Anaerolineales bacterium]|nr:ribulose-phosphate 3-epimerase [Anaerolineales bacterium]